jgi:hypothetical protein
MSTVGFRCFYTTFSNHYNFKVIKKMSEQSAVHRKKAVQLGKIPSKKEQARLELQRFKDVEKQIRTTEGQYDRLYNMKSAMESALRTTQIVKVQESANAQLKELTKNIDIDKVEDMAAEFEDNAQLLDDVNATLARPMGPVMDDDELMEELAQLEREDLASADTDAIPTGAAVEVPDSVFAGMASVPSTLPLPSVPTAAPATATAEKSDEEKQLAALMAEME